MKNQWVLLFKRVEIYVKAVFVHNLQHADEDALRNSFPALNKLHVNQIELEDWDALDKLHHIPNLRDLRLLGTKLWANDTAPKTFGSPTKTANIE